MDCKTAFLLVLMPLALYHTDQGMPSLRQGMRRISQVTPPAAMPVAEVGFSPEGDAEQLILKLLQSARSTVHLASYTFSNPAITSALIQARERGVEVAVLTDYAMSLFSTEQKPRGIRQLIRLTRAGIPVRTIRRYAIHHDKYIIVDNQHIQTGSFNYTIAAANLNSENVVVLWNFPDLAKSYQDHWQNRWNQGKPFRPRQISVMPD